MYNFFVNKQLKKDAIITIVGEDFNHIKNVLRMKVGEKIYLSANSKTALCVISDFTNDSVIVKVLEEDCLGTELPIEIYLFQGLIKADKFELVLQKAVELGVKGIYPVEMSRSVVKIEEKKKSQKTERWQAIAEAGAKQSKRNIVPTVFEPISYKNAVKLAKEMDLFLVPYENKNGMKPTLDALKKIKDNVKVAILIGPEGGFEENEIELAKTSGGEIISLGKRILRAETASITAISACMMYAEININKD
ncbi:MAG: 16S rRNA (uracil(1498)-N(3))-methyltransferase [Clostridia bacterium]|nr:16S rRNA (uracil(1498)-N(3))-methyltransferase [Clostridia bacterium]